MWHEQIQIDTNVTQTKHKYNGNYTDYFHNGTDCFLEPVVHSAEEFLRGSGDGG